VSGGSNVFAGIVAAELSIASENRSSWVVVVANASTFAKGEVQAFAYCAQSGQAVSASAPRSAHTQAVAQEKRLMAELAQRVREERVRG
jgi:hypothetical protein